MMISTGLARHRNAAIDGRDSRRTNRTEAAAGAAEVETAAAAAEPPRPGLAPPPPPPSPPVFLSGSIPRTERSSSSLSSSLLSSKTKWLDETLPPAMSSSQSNVSIIPNTPVPMVESGNAIGVVRQRRRALHASSSISGTIAAAKTIATTTAPAEAAATTTTTSATTTTAAPAEAAATTTRTTTTTTTASITGTLSHPLVPHDNSVDGHQGESEWRSQDRGVDRYRSSASRTEDMRTSLRKQILAAKARISSTQQQQWQRRQQQQQPQPQQQQQLQQQQQQQQQHRQQLEERRAEVDDNGGRSAKSDDRGERAHRRCCDNKIVTERADLGEPASAADDGSDSVFISVKTTKANHRTRLPPILQTWFRLARKQTFFFTDTADGEISRATGNHLLVTGCPTGHSRRSLSCKMNSEFDAFATSSKKWWCHFDDDNYVNVPALYKVLRRYDPAKKWYLGRNSLTRPIDLDTKDWGPVRFRFATGGAGFCISRALADVMEPHALGGRLAALSNRIRLPDDVTIGFLVEVIVGARLTVTREFHSHLEELALIEGPLSEQVSFSYAKKRNNFVKLDKILPDDPTRFKSVHCALFPNEALCERLQTRRLAERYRYPEEQRSQPTTATTVNIL